jgi:nucleotide sugar dehydrogenase
LQHVIVVGCGSIGLPLAVAFAQRGIQVTGVDIDAALVDRLSEGSMRTEEQDLAEALKLCLRNGALQFATTIPVTGGNTAFIIAVPTPIDDQDRFRPEAIEGANDAIVTAAADGDLVAIRSTVPIGFTRRLAAAAEASGRRLAFASCPDRSVTGKSFADQFNVPSIVGGLDSKATQAACDLFARLGQVRVVSSAEAAETLKLFANVQRDTLFALSNQFAQICEAADLDFRELLDAGSFQYARFALPRAGPVGGPCLTKDVFLLAESAEARGVDVSLLRQARKVNRGIVEALADRICRQVEPLGRPAAVAILGMAFKGSPPVIDQRNSFGHGLLAALRARHAKIDIRTWDPATDPGPEGRLSAVDKADVVVLANDHPALADLDSLTGARARATIFDMCGVVGPDAAIPNGLSVSAFGSPGNRTG